MKKLLILSGLVMTSISSAQEPPPVVRSMFENFKPGHRVLSKVELSKDQKDLIDKSTTRGPDYLTVQVEPSYLSQLNDIDVANWLVRRRHDQEIVAGSAKLLGRFNEGVARVNFVFGNGATPTAMLTVWDISSSGSSVVTVEENQNQKIGQTPATLSLAKSDKTLDCLWKVFAVENGIVYEFVMLDKIGKNGVPQLQPARVMALVKKLVESVKNRELD